MTGNGTNEIKARNVGYNLNTTSSTIKTTIDAWFKTNLTNEENTNIINYQEYLEDTIWCNDRSFKTEGSSKSYIQSGWNPNGGNLDTILSFGTANRAYNNWYSTTNVPSIECQNITDKFSVSNSKAKIKYPIGLITVDEVVLAGADTGNNTIYYLYRHHKNI